MPEQTKIDVSHFSVEELVEQLTGLWKDMEEAQLRVTQVHHDIQLVENELFRKLGNQIANKLEVCDKI